MAKNAARPKRKSDPRNVCVLDARTAKKLLEQEALHIGFRCRSRLHRHIPAKEAKAMVRAGELVWVGEHHKVATYAEEKVWAKTRSGDVTTMQWLPLHKVLGRRRRPASSVSTDGDAGEPGSFSQ